MENNYLIINFIYNSISACPPVNPTAITMVTSSGSCSCGTPTPDDLTLCLQTGEWIEISFEVLQLLTGMELTFSGTEPHNPLVILLEYRIQHHELHTINITTSNSSGNAGGEFPLVRHQQVAFLLNLFINIFIYEVAISVH